MQPLVPQTREAELSEPSLTTEGKGIVRMWGWFQPGDGSRRQNDC